MKGFALGIQTSIGIHNSIKKAKFSSFPVLPKSHKVKQNWISSFFVSNQAHMLSHELCDFLLTNPILEEEFPFLQKKTECYANFMILHYFLLTSRIMNETGSEAKTLVSSILHVAKTDNYIKLAEKINPHLPAQDFSGFFIENYSNRLEIIQNSIFLFEKEMLKEVNDKEYFKQELTKLLRKIIFFNEIPLESAFSLKLFMYYEAHRNYLNSLDLFSIMRNRIYWGLSTENYILPDSNKN